MANKKLTNKYYFTVEGETEKWYLKWLEEKIKNSEDSKVRACFDCSVEKNLAKKAKSITITGKTEIWHLADYESSDQVHVKEFHNIMDNMYKVKSLSKQIIYKFGYSNLTFDLWIILHMTNCNGSIFDRKNYIKYINDAYSEKFASMNEYKRETNFKRCLSKLEISNVIDAVNRAENIMTNNKSKGYILEKYKGYEYYKENPSLSIWEIIKKILKDCGLI